MLAKDSSSERKSLSDDAKLETVRSCMNSLGVLSSAQLVPYRTAGDDYAQTERLKAKFARRRRERRPLYLTCEEFDEILRWKLRDQYDRGKARWITNTEAVVRTVTGAAFSITLPDEDYEIELRLGLLCCMRGVGVPVASAVLALVFPEKYAVIDFRGWRQVFNEERRAFSIADYKRYLRAVSRLAEELGWPVQEVDLAIWEYDRVSGIK